MAVVSHLDMFYDTRLSVHVSETDPSANPNSTENSVPEAATIHYKDGEDQVVDPEEIEAPNGKDFETARFLIGRALLDPDATVEPL